MIWLQTCHESKAGKRQQSRVRKTMAAYLMLLFGSIWLVKHVPVHGVALYAVSIMPAIPVILVLIWMGLYLQEETDEYLRMVTIRALLAGTAALLAVVVVSDFLRIIAEQSAPPPLVFFVVFFLAFGIAQWVQKLRNRGGGDA